MRRSILIMILIKHPFQYEISQELGWGCEAWKEGGLWGEGRRLSHPQYLKEYRAALMGNREKPVLTEFCTQ